MNFNFKKAVAMLSAFAVSAVALCFSSDIFSSAADEMKYEFEDGTISGGSTIKSDTNASGGSCVFIESAGDTASVSVDIAESGAYKLIIGYSAEYGAKTQLLNINGSNQGQISFPSNSSGEYKELNFGIVMLNSGTNTIEIEASWGWMNCDYIRLEQADISSLEVKDKSPCDNNLTDEAKGLFSYLQSVYGTNIIMGQQEYYGVSREDEFDYIKEKTGKLPAIRGFDFGDTCPLYAWDDGTAGRIISWVNDNNGIATASWHVNVPVTMDEYTVGQTMAWDKTTYSQKTDFVTANCMVEGTKEYEFFLQAVDNLAAELLKLQDANVPLLFRPFHEAEGGGGADGSGAWFWWSKEGAQTYIQLYQYLYDLLTEKYGLHNLIWEFNSYTYAESSLWYPGADYVDLIGYDKYNATSGNPNESAISSTFFNLVDMYDSQKMIALMECDTIPSVTNMTTEGAYWLYCMPWYGEHLYDYNNADTLNELYNSDVCITLDELPDYKSMGSEVGTRVTTSKTTPVSTTTTTAYKVDIENASQATLKKSTAGYDLTFKKEMGDTVYLIIDTAEDITYANGCIGVSVELNGQYYWVAYMWVKDSSDNTVKLSLDDDLFEISTNNGKDKVTDESLIAQLKEIAKQQTTAQYQVWYAGAGEEAADTSSVQLIAAYVLDGSEPITTEPTETTTTETEITSTEVTETESSEAPSSTTSTSKTTTSTSKTTTTTTTTEPVETVTTKENLPDATKYGDVNTDDKINVADVILLNKYIVGADTISDQGLANAECYADGRTDINDSAQIMNVVVMTLSETDLPVSP